MFCVINNIKDNKKKLVVFDLVLGTEMSLIELDLVNDYKDFDCCQ